MTLLACTALTLLTLTAIDAYRHRHPRTICGTCGETHPTEHLTLHADTHHAGDEDRTHP